MTRPTQLRASIWIAGILALIGAAIIIWGMTCLQRESIRVKLGSYLLLGVEFLIVGRWELCGFLGEATFAGSLLFGRSRCEIPS